MTTKQNKIESMKIMNLNCDIFLMFNINSSTFVVLLFMSTDFGWLVGVVTNWIDSVKKRVNNYF